jgi:hypothetical protein
MENTEATRKTEETTMILEGPAPFLDVVYETIEAHVQRTGEEYEQVVTGVGSVDAGDVDHEEEAVLHVYVLGGVEPEEAREWVGLALDRIADDHDMDLARQSVQVHTENEDKL